MTDELLLQAIQYCATAKWHSLSRLVYEVSTFELKNKSTQAIQALFQYYIQYSRPACLVQFNNRSDVSAFSVFSSNPIELAIAFQYLLLAEQAVLLNDNERVYKYAFSYLQNLQAATILLGLTLNHPFTIDSPHICNILVSNISAQHQIHASLLLKKLPSEFTFVLGMHRSGTSAMTGFLSNLGYENMNDLMPVSEANPKGYWESLAICNANNDLLLHLDTNWWEPNPLPANWMYSESAVSWRRKILAVWEEAFTSESKPIIKDPRFCILLPGLLPWMESLEISFRFLIVFRHPLEVAASLWSRDRIPALQSIRLWLNYVFSADKSIQNHHHVYILFEQLMASPNAVLEHIQSHFSSNFIEPSAANADTACTFIDPYLYRSRPDTFDIAFLETLDNKAIELDIALRLFDILQKLAQPHQTLEEEGLRKKFIHLESIWDSIQFIG